MARVDLKRLLGREELRARRIGEGLALHDPLHVGRVAVLRRDEHARRGGKALADGHLLDLVSEVALEEGRKAAEASLVGRLAALAVLAALAGQHEALLRDALQLVAVNLGQVLHAVLVDRVRHEDHLDARGREALEEGAVLHLLPALARDVVDGLLLGLHGGDVLLEATPAGLARHARVPAQQLGELGAVGRVLDHAELDVLAELVPELGVDRVGTLLQVRGDVDLLLGALVALVAALSRRLGRLCRVELLLRVCRAGVLLVLHGLRLHLRKLPDHLEHLAHELLGHDLDDLALLQLLAAHVERQVVRVDDAAHKVEVARHQVLELVRDEHLADVQLER